MQEKNILVVWDNVTRFGKTNVCFLISSHHLVLDSLDRFSKAIENSKQITLPSIICSFALPHLIAYCILIIYEASAWPVILVFIFNTGGVYVVFCNMGPWA